MAETKNPRIKRLSTRFLGFYKNSVLILLIALLGVLLFITIQSIYKVGLLRSNFISIGIFLYLIYKWIKLNRNVHRVEFDDEYLYVIQKEQDIMIPLENIKEIDIKTLGGVYEVELYHPEQLGDKFYFKPSLLYPFNFKQKDSLVDILRRNINLAQARKKTVPTNALHS